MTSKTVCPKCANPENWTRQPRWATKRPGLTKRAGASRSYLVKCEASQQSIGARQQTHKAHVYGINFPQCDCCCCCHWSIPRESGAKKKGHVVIRLALLELTGHTHTRLHMYKGFDTSLQWTRSSGRFICELHFPIHTPPASMFACSARTGIIQNGWNRQNFLL